MTKELAVKFFLYLGFVISYLEYLYRIMTGDCASWHDIKEFLAEKGITNASSPEELSELRTNFIWRPDKTYLIFPVDYAKHPLVLFHDRTDDCDGFALFYEKIFHKLGFSNISRVYTMTEKGRGHAVCVVKIRDHHYAFSNWPVIMLSSNELPDIGKIISRGMQEKLAFSVRAMYNTVTEYHHE